MNKIQDWLGKFPARVALLLYFSVGLVQFGVIPAGLEGWLGIHWMYGVMCAALLAWIPVAGQAAGFAAAVNVLNWPMVACAALFLWPVWFFPAALIVRRIAAGRSSANGQDDAVGRRFGDIDRTRMLSPGGSVAPHDDSPPHVRTRRPFRSAA